MCGPSLLAPSPPNLTSLPCGGAGLNGEGLRGIGSACRRTKSNVSLHLGLLLRNGQPVKRIPLCTSS